MANTTDTEATIRLAARELAPAVIAIRAVDPELSRIIQARLADTLQAYRDAKRADADAAATEARMLASAEVA